MAQRVIFQMAIDNLWLISSRENNNSYKFATYGPLRQGMKRGAYYSNNKLFTHVTRALKYM